MPKIVSLSRKGFDSAYGGTSSPIIDNKVYSLPIPSSETKMFSQKYSKKYKDLKFDNLRVSTLLIIYFFKYKGLRNFNC